VFSGWTIVAVSSSTPFAPSTAATLLAVNGSSIVVTFASAVSHGGRQIAANNTGASNATVNGVTLAPGAYATWIAGTSAWLRVS
jgi:hypothetical protein